MNAEMHRERERGGGRNAQPQHFQESCYTEETLQADSLDRSMQNHLRIPGTDCLRAPPSNYCFVLSNIILPLSVPRVLFILWLVRCMDTVVGLTYFTKSRALLTNA